MVSAMWKGLPCLFACVILFGCGEEEEICPMCGGTGWIEKKLAYQVVDTDSEVFVGSYTLIIFPSRYDQRCSVKIRNMDDKAGYFTVKFKLHNTEKTEKESKALIEPGLEKTVSVIFLDVGSEGYEWSYEVIPEKARFRCPMCGGTGKIKK